MLINVIIKFSTDKKGQTFFILLSLNHETVTSHCDLTLLSHILMQGFIQTHVLSAVEKTHMCKWCRENCKCIAPLWCEESPWHQKRQQSQPQERLHPTHHSSWRWSSPRMQQLCSVRQRRAELQHDERGKMSAKKKKRDVQYDYYDFMFTETRWSDLPKWS